MLVVVFVDVKVECKCHPVFETIEMIAGTLVHGPSLTEYSGQAF